MGRKVGWSECVIEGGGRKREGWEDRSFPMLCSSPLSSNTAMHLLTKS